MVLALEPLLQHVELKHAHHAHDHAFHAGANLAEYLDRTLLCKLLHSLHELLALHGVHLADARKMLRREGRDARILHAALTGAERVANREDARIEEAHDVARVRLVHDGAVVGHHGRARGELELAPALHMESVHTAFELARADAQEGDAVAVVLVHVGLDLEHEAGELVRRRVDQLARERILMRARCRRKPQEVFEERLYAEVSERRTKEDGAELARTNGLQVEFVCRSIKKLDVVYEVTMVLGPDELIERRIAQLGLNLIHLLGGIRTAVALESEHMAARALEDAAEILAAADGPVHGIGRDAEHRLNLVQEIERVARLAVELVHEGEDGNTAQRTDAKELNGLRLNALRAINHHDGGVGGHERTVRIFRKVLVAGGVQDIHAATIVGELQHRRSHRDAALLLDLHPVGDRVLGTALPLHRTRRLDGTGIEEELLGKCGLARVRVRDDGEGASRSDLFGDAWHGSPLRNAPVCHALACGRRRARRRAAGASASMASETCVCVPMMCDFNRTYCNALRPRPRRLRTPSDVESVRVRTAGPSSNFILGQDCVETRLLEPSFRHILARE